MNMISTAFPIETGASSNQKNLVSKLVSAWEKKNSKTARAGGVSLMALSLAACGAEDETPFAQTDIDAATAPLTAAVQAAQTQAATALVAQAAAETQAATALVAQAAAETQAATALVAQAAAEATAAAAVVGSAAATAAKAVADAALVTAQAETAAAKVAEAAAVASLSAKTAEYDALVVTNTSLQTNYDAIVAPVTLVATTAADTLQGNMGDDTFTAAAGTVAATDRFTDSSITDNDTLTITHATAPGAFNSTNIENIVMNLNSVGAIAVDGQNCSGVTNLTVTRGDVVVGGVSLTGNKTLDINNIDASEVAKITAGAGTTSVNIDAEGAIAATGKAGLILEADTATTTVDVDLGASTINAANALTRVAIDGAVYTGAAELAKPSIINAAKAATVTSHANLTGTVEINAAAATVLTVNNAGGGATINGSTTSTADSTITAVNIDNSGATITTGTGSSVASAKQINVTIDGTVAATDTATINAAGVIALDVDGSTADAVDILNLNTIGGAVTYNISTPTGGTDNSIQTITGTSDVTISGASAAFTGVAISGTAKIDLSSGSTGTVLDADSWINAGKVDVGYDVGAAVSYYNGANFELTLDQTGLDLDLYAGGAAQTVTITAGDEDVNNSAVGTVTVGALTVDDADDTVAGTITIEASESNFTATSFDFGALQNLVITGDENVNLGQTTGGATTQIDATGSSGIITLTSTTLAPTINTGSGADAITVNGADVHTVNTNDGNDDITITNTSDTSIFTGGAGNDTFTLTPTTKFVVVGGDGNDTFTTGDVIDAVIVGGNGTDTITLDNTRDLSARDSFAMSGIEAIDITAGNFTIDSGQFAGDNTFEITANGDIFRVDVDTTGGTIDASGVTLKSTSTATFIYSGSAGVDTLTGGVAAESFLQTAGADSISGGATGLDTLVLAATNFDIDGSLTGDTATGVVVNLGSANVDEATVLNQVTRHFGEGSTTLVGGSASFLFTNAAAATAGQVNAVVTQTVSGIENVTGGTGNDYIIGNSAANVVNGAAGTDYITLGDGNDTVNIVAGTDGNSDVMVGGNGTDTLNITTGLTATIDNDTDLVTFENVVLAGTANITLTGQTEVLNITGGTGANTIVGGGGIDTITAGLAADIITGGGGLDVYNFAAGDSAVTIAGSGDNGTIAGMDQILDIVAGSGSANSETVNVGGTGAKATAGASTGTDSTLTVGGKAVKSHSVSAAGLVTFDDADTFVGAIAIANTKAVAAAVQYLQANDIGAAGTTVAMVVSDNGFGSDAGSVNEMVLFTQGDATGSDNSLDQIVFLHNGGAVDALITTNGTGANDLFIA